MKKKNLLQTAFFSFVSVLFLGLVAATPLPQTQTNHFKTVKKAPIVIYSTISNTFTVNNCTVTITHPIAYVLDENTFILLQVYVSSNFNMQINCTGGGRNPFLYEIRASNVTFDVSNGEITNVDFATTNDSDVNNIISNTDFKNSYKNWVNSEKP
jgi:hypothetical protein